MRRIIKFLIMAAILSIAMGLYAQNNFIISPEMTEKQIDDEIKAFIDKELESLGIEQGDEEYQHVQQMVEKIEERLRQINEEQSSFIDSYGNHDKDDLKRAMKLLRNLYYAERTVSSLLIDGYYKNSDEYNNRLVEDMGLIEEEVVNLKAYEDEIQANIRIAYESLNKSYDSMKNLADIIEGYKNIIAEQQKIIRDEIAGNGAWGSKGFGDISFSLLGGTGWYGEAVLTAPDVQVGFEVEFALNSWFGVGIGAMTSLPVRGNQVFLAVCFTPGR